jgi:hypothetical protein
MLIEIPLLITITVGNIQTTNKEIHFSERSRDFEFTTPQRSRDFEFTTPQRSRDFEFTTPRKRKRRS